jgi:hypothetical protein
VVGGVTDFDADHAQATFAEGPRLFALDFDLNGGGFSRGDVSQLPDPQIAVAARDVEEEVADGAQARGSCCFSGFRADAFQRAQALVEDAGTGPVDRGVEERRPIQTLGAGKGARHRRKATATPGRAG